MENIKQQLKEKRISNRKLARALSLNESTINQIINGKYAGAKETEEHVLKYIIFTLIDKPDLNPKLYENADLFIRALSHSVRSMKVFTDDEAHIMLDLILILKTYLKENRFEKK